MDGTCRFCGKREDGMVHYSTRHYAHPACFLDNGHTLDELHGWQIGQLPWRVLKDRGLMEKAEVMIAANHFPTRRRSRAKPF
jgi:hypothetical protein